MTSRADTSACIGRFLPAPPLVDPLEYPLDELLVISLLGQGRGVEIHGCGVADGSNGYLFVGQSGAGKTTIARLWQAEPGAVILSDDRVVLRSEADGIWMYGTPWHGEEPLASPGRVRLAGVFFLKHHDRHEMASVTRVDGVTRLFASSFPPFHDAHALDFTLAFIDSIVARVPCFELRFTPDATVLDLVRRRCEARGFERLSPATADNSGAATRHPPCSDIARSPASQRGPAQRLCRSDPGDYVFDIRLPTRRRSCMICLQSAR